MFDFASFFLMVTATTEIYTLSLHDALPIFRCRKNERTAATRRAMVAGESPAARIARRVAARSEEHTSELQSRFELVCRLLLEKKKQQNLTRFICHFIFPYDSNPPTAYHVAT